MPADAYLKRFSGASLPVEVCLDTEGKPICCEVCGFVNVRATFENGWQMEMCSALPLATVDKPAFKNWLTTLSGKADDCQATDFKPILHDR
jgi:hypothetical protein